MLDRFLSSVSLIEKFPFMASSVVRQTKSDHDAIILDMWGCKPKEFPKEPRLCFKFDGCWATDREAKSIISSAWNRGVLSYFEKIDNSSQRIDSVNALKKTRCRLDHLYAKEEKYWAQRSRSQ
ncbi:hypothetical protein GOBAR_DD23981 [Gossypium barbadense]|nr:hypothetical protein GOBAR_DD23981 [Gossypium barbadense]